MKWGWPQTASIHCVRTAEFADCDGGATCIGAFADEAVGLEVPGVGGTGSGQIGSVGPAFAAAGGEGAWGEAAFAAALRARRAPGDVAC